MSGPLTQRFNGAEIDADAAVAMATSRGLHYGDGVFRTFLRRDGRVVDRDGQLAKLRSDALHLQLQPPPAKTLADDLDALGSEPADAALKLTLIRRGGARGYRAADDRCDRLVAVHPLTGWPVTHWTQGIVAFRSAVTLAAQPRLAGIKHLNRLEQVLASRDWPEGGGEGILCDDAGRPVCGTRSNLFWIRQGELRTPALDRCGVAGRTRQRVLEQARTLGLPTRIDLFDWTELMAADEAFFTNSLFGLWPLRQLGPQAWPAPGPQTGALMLALDHPRIVAA